MLTEADRAAAAKFRLTLVGLLPYSPDRADIQKGAPGELVGDGSKPTKDMYEIDIEEFGVTMRITIESSPVTKNVEKFQRIASELVTELVQKDGWRSDGMIASGRVDKCVVDKEVN